MNTILLSLTRAIVFTLVAVLPAPESAVAGIDILAQREPPFRLNMYTVGEQENPFVFWIPGTDDDEFYVAYDGDTDDGQYNVRMRVNTPLGPLDTTMMTVGESTDRRQEGAIGGLDAFGSLVLAWRNGDDEFASDVEAKALVADGSNIELDPIRPFTIDDTFFKHAIIFRVLRANFGEAVAFLVCASSGASGQVSPDIYCRALAMDFFGPPSGNAQAGETPSGVVGGPEFVVHSDTSGYQYHPAGCATKDGGFVIVWEELGGDGDRDGLFARKFDSEFAPEGDDFAVNTYTTNDQENASVCCRRDGGFTVVWSSQSRGIAARMFDASAIPAGDDFLVSEPDSISESEPLITCDGRDNFVVSWMDPGFPGRIVTRGFDKDATPLTEEIDVANGSADARINERTIGADITRAGALALSWSQEDDTGANDVYAVVYDFDGGGSTTTTTTTTTTLPAPLCGDPSENPGTLVAGTPERGTVITATDALFVLNAGVGLASCALCVCDVNNSGSTTAGDALVVLNAAVGSPVVLDCPPCT